MDYELFDHDAGLWWSEDSHCVLLQSIIPARLEYIRHIFNEQYGRDLRGKKVLDIGCGGGLFTEEMAGLGCRITGIDPSARSIKIAEKHARQKGFNISYSVTSGEHIPFDDDSFDLVYCCDVLEHVSDVNSVISESSRVIKSDGIYFYDTVNRTWLSRFFMITLFQEWLRIVPQGLHDWHKFIRPKELQGILRCNGLEPRDMIGLLPDMSPIKSAKRFIELLKLKRGEISYAQFGQDILYQTSPFLFMNYIGYATKHIRNT